MKTIYIVMHKNERTGSVEIVGAKITKASAERCVHAHELFCENHDLFWWYSTILDD